LLGHTALAVANVAETFSFQGQFQLREEKKSADAKSGE
jgi:hypothetical protein